MRTEKDHIGEVSIPASALYGIHSFRARENFPGQIPFPEEWYRATGTVKLADGEIGYGEWGDSKHFQKRVSHA